jgi:hypothetical protein
LDDDDDVGGSGSENNDNSIRYLFPCLLSSQGRFQSTNTKQWQIKQKKKEGNN